MRRIWAVVPSKSGRSSVTSTSAWASSVSSIESIVPTGWPATSTWFPGTSWPPVWKSIV